MRKKKSANTSTMIGPDLISSLPDLILHRILGFLQTNEAVKTCVLSKRWEHLWASVCSLRFDLDIDFGQWDTERIAKFVNAVMLRREPLDLDVFILHCGDTIMDEHVSDWINYAVKHRPRVFFLWHFSSLPSCFYSCTSIEELYLAGCDEIKYRNVNLPKLKKLVMSRIFNAPSLKNLLSGCPIMEYLKLNYFFSSECVIAHEHLKHLEINLCDLNPLLIDAPNLLSFSYLQRDNEIKLLAPPHEAALNMPSLILASLKIGDFTMSTHLEGVTLMLKSFSNVEQLKLQFSRDQQKELCGLLLPELPMFHKLKNVTVVFHTLACFQVVTWILKSSPNLKKLTMVQDYYGLGFEEREATTSESTNASLTVAITSCKKLEIIEVRYDQISEMVGQLVDALVDGAKELENLEILSSKLKRCGRERVNHVLKVELPQQKVPKQGSRGRRKTQSLAQLAAARIESSQGASTSHVCENKVSCPHHKSTTDSDSSKEFDRTRPVNLSEVGKAFKKLRMIEKKSVSIWLLRTLRQLIEGNEAVLSKPGNSSSGLSSQNDEKCNVRWKMSEDELLSVIYILDLCCDLVQLVKFLSWLLSKIRARMTANILVGRHAIQPKNRENQICQLEEAFIYSALQRYENVLVAADLLPEVLTAVMNRNSGLVVPSGRHPYSAAFAYSRYLLKKYREVASVARWEKSFRATCDQRLLPELDSSRAIDGDIFGNHSNDLHGNTTKSFVSQPTKIAAAVSALVLGAVVHGVVSLDRLITVFRLKEGLDTMQFIRNARSSNTNGVSCFRVWIPCSLQSALDKMELPLTIRRRIQPAMPYLPPTCPFSMPCLPPLTVPSLPFLLPGNPSSNHPQRNNNPSTPSWTPPNHPTGRGKDQLPSQEPLEIKIDPWTLLEDGTAGSSTSTSVSGGGSSSMGVAGGDHSNLKASSWLKGAVRVRRTDLTYIGSLDDDS